MSSVILVVPNISCEHCVRTVTETLKPLDGVQDVDVTLRTKQVYVEFDASRVDVERMSAALDAEDYAVAAVAEVEA